MQTKRHPFGRQTSCRYCGHDIENHGRRQWIDRGTGRQCLPYKGRDGEIVQPKTKHAPHPDTE